MDKLTEELINEALLEIERTAIAAGKEGAAAEAGKALYYEKLSISLLRDKELLEKRIVKLEKRFYITAGAALCLGALMMTGRF